MPATGCILTGLGSYDKGNSVGSVSIYPNPFSGSINIDLNDAPRANKIELSLYNLLGKKVLNSIITKQSTSLPISNLPSGIYFYKVTGDNKIIQSGRLISKQ